MQQQVGEGGGTASSSVDGAMMRGLLDAALRPGLHAAPVQQRAGTGGDASTSQVHEAAAAGISGASSTLPHLDTIQRAFGHHDVGHVQAHTDAAAAAGARAMGAEAFATGSHVAFAGPASLHTAAHEAAHVIQQAGGVHLAGGVGEVGDTYERHADAVADRVVRGESAEALLDEMRPPQPASTGAGAVQRVKWDGWLENLKNVAPTTASKATLGMAIVNALRDRGVVGRIGGSLSAAMFGGRRQPRDIDIDIPGHVLELNDAKEVFFSMIKRQGTCFASDKDLFFIQDWQKTSEGYLLRFHQLQADKALDPLMDDEEIEQVRTRIHGPPAEVSVDFSSETAFSSSGVKVGSNESDPGYYGPDFLAASYLNRLATNTVEQQPDAKGDRDQIAALLVHQIKKAPDLGRPLTEGDVVEMLKHLKLQVFANLASSNPRGPLIDQLFDQIVPQVIAEVVPRQPLDPTSLEEQLRAIPSLPMHEDESPQLPVPQELVAIVSQLVLKPLNLD